jgi:hypothetical protein
MTLSKNKLYSNPTIKIVIASETKQSQSFTKEFISKTSLNACFCHAGLSGIFLQEGFPTSGNDIQVALLMTILVSLAS